MEVAVDVVLVAAGALLIVVTLTSVIRTTILPRGVSSPIARDVLFALRVLFRLRIGRSPTFERRDRVMAMFGPVYLLSLLLTWLLLLLFAYTAIYYGLGVHPLRSAFELSGSAIFTLGTASTAKFGPTIVTYSEAGLGLLLLTLLITYLPTIYTAFSRREVAVTQLEVRAGTPPSAVALLIPITASKSSSSSMSSGSNGRRGSPTSRKPTSLFLPWRSFVPLIPSTHG